MTAHALKAALKTQSAGEAVNIKGTDRPAAGVLGKLPTPADVTGALSLYVSADNLRAVAKSARERGDHTVAKCREIEADEMDRSVVSVLIPDEPLGPPGIGGELVPLDEEMENAPAVYDTLKTSPDMVNATASRERLSLAANAGALIMGTDIAETIRARNSLEKMLAHQLGAVHLLAMKFNEKASRHLDLHTLHADGGRWIIGVGAKETGQQRDLQILLVEASRAANTATRLASVFQEGLLTIDRIRRGGKQTVKVVHVHQHVAVKDGGQAVIAGGDVKGGGRKRRDFPRSTRGGPKCKSDQGE
jgi:hypothetical protein